MYGRILKSLNIVNLYRGMSKLKLKINVKAPQLLCNVVSVALMSNLSDLVSKTHQVAQIRHSEPQKRQYTATEVLLHLF